MRSVNAGFRTYNYDYFLTETFSERYEVVARQWYRKSGTRFIKSKSALDRGALINSKSGLDRSLTPLLQERSHKKIKWLP